MNPKPLPTPLPDRVAAIPLALLSLLLSSCLEVESSVCQSDLLCPTGMRCAVRQDVCIAASPSCGDAIIQGLEVCDLGDVRDGDGCSADCKSDESCGNGVVDTTIGEVCDTKDPINGFKCSEDCGSLQSCGNGFVDAGEECDDGNDDNDDNCLNSCQIARCGDGFTDVQPPSIEVCDPRSDPANCDVDCTPRECGDGFVNGAAGEECDAPSHEPGRLCSDECKIPRCGNGKVEPGEGCDDANTNNSDSCLNTCQASTCGDGYVNPGLEQCDSGGGEPETTCPYGTPTCTTCNKECKLVPLTGAYCGDGKKQDGLEVCDDGNTDSCGSCSSNCGALQQTRPTGKIEVVAGGDIEDKEKLIISDGLRTVTFEFTDNWPPGKHQIPIGGNREEMALKIDRAIDAARDAKELLIDSQHYPTYVYLEHLVAGTLGNQPIHETVEDSDFRVTGMSGGLGGNCPSGMSCSRTEDCEYGLVCRKLSGARVGTCVKP